MSEEEEIIAFGRKPPHADHIGGFNGMVLTPSPDLEFVKAWLKETRIRPWCAELIIQAYEAGYDSKSDGFSLPWKRIPILRSILPKELGWEELDRPHPVAVAHDFGYETHCMTRQKLDLFLEHSLEDLNHPVRAKLWYRAVRLFGGWHWH